MLDGSAKVAGKAPETRHSNPPLPGDRELPNATDARMAQLHEQEQLWFSWVTILHERLDKADMRDNRAVLEIARRRWLEAKEALQRCQAGDCNP
jgi:hypothetical protein